MSVEKTVKEWCGRPSEFESEREALRARGKGTRGP